MKPKVHARNRLHALLRVVLAGLLTGLVSPTAPAQSVLLQVDYNKSVIFHVLSDGRVLLPLGATAGYVLTADGSGYGTWQAVSGSGSSVITAATLTGDGTAGDPLGVAVPLTLTGTTTGLGGIVQGLHTDGHYGILGGSSFGVGGVHASGNDGLLGNEDYGVWGRNTNGHFGYFGSSDYGAYGEHENGNYGFFGSGGATITFGYGVYGQHNNGTYGYLGGVNNSVYGEHESGAFGQLGGFIDGASGMHANGNGGRLGTTNSGVLGTGYGNRGRLGHEDYGAYGEFGFDGNFGYLGGVSHGVYGEHANGNNGYLGNSAYGALGVHTNGNFGYLGSNNYGVYGSTFFGTGTHAGYFQGNVEVTGTLTGGSAAFKVDHPLDPEGKYLSHSFVESPDMMNVYNGNITTDARGEAVVELPEYFEAFNRDFRYQLTVIGTFAQAIIAEKMRGNHFVIRTDQPNVEVSWQVTGIRQDRWANENRIVVEQDKPSMERGFYLHPKLYGQPQERSVEWARDPEGMRAMKERPARIEAERERRKEQQQQDEQEHQRMQAERERMKTERERMKTKHERMKTERAQRPPPPRGGQQ